MSTPIYRDPAQPVAARVADLLARLTVEEKVALLNLPLGFDFYQHDADGVRLSEALLARLAGEGLGSLYGLLRADSYTLRDKVAALTPAQGAELVNAVQCAALERSRLGIPLLLVEECSHGFMTAGATVFPAPIGVGCTWNPDLYRRMCRAIAVETRAQGAVATCSPVLDVVRDPRWGRIEETFGEDPYLCTQMGLAAVAGLQGDDLAAGDAILPILKHFAAHGIPEGGHNTAPAHVGLRELYEVCLAPFAATVAAGAQFVMASYNEIDGLPSHGSRFLLTDVLRDEWGFAGAVISDWGGITKLVMQGLAADNVAAAAQALDAGVDMEICAAAFAEPLLQAVREGRVPPAQLDAAVSRLLRLTILTGLFEQPFADPAHAAAVTGCPEHRALSREVARQSIVLLKNDGLLPLRRVSRLAVIGPNADAVGNQLGDYTTPQRREEVATVLDGVRAVSGAEVRYARGCGILDPSTDGFADAVAIAQWAEVAIVVVGGSSARDCGVDPATGALLPGGASEMDTGEGLDRATLGLSGAQQALVQAVHATGTPVVVVFINGRPVSEPWIAEHVPAILEAWYPGGEGGHAVAEVLFGACNPAGRLTVSIPRDASQLPVFYNHKPAARGDYLDADVTPLYPFGFGLSYTTFAYANLCVTPAQIPPDGTAAVSVEVTNIGDMAGDEVVQLYLRDEVASVTQPVRALKGFRRLRLAPGETAAVTFTLGPAELRILDRDYRWTVEPGAFTLAVGGNQQDVLTTTLEVQP
jgi:beta-glucosidase